MCPETTSLKNELDQLRFEMRVCQDKIEFFASKKRQRQLEMLNIHRDMENYNWANSITQQIISSPKTGDSFIAPCDISEGKCPKLFVKMFAFAVIITVT